MNSDSWDNHFGFISFSVPFKNMIIEINQFCH
nr:MAG TPA: hypothetical protein [Caudoviricetes sp.]